MKAMYRLVGLTLLATVILVGSNSDAFAFGPALDREKLAAEEERVAAMRKQMGDEAFATFAIARLQRVAAALPKQHPLYQERALIEGTPENAWEIDEYMLLAILPELEATGDARAVNILQTLVTLRKVQVQDEPFLSYGSFMFHDRVLKAYLSLALKHSSEPLELIRDSLEKWGWLEEVVDAVSDGAEMFGGSYPREQIVPFLRSYADWSLRAAPVAGSQLASELRGTIDQPELLLDLAVDVHPTEALLMLLIAANDRRLDDPHGVAASERWCQLVKSTWEGRLAVWEAQPLADHIWQKLQLTRLGQIVVARPDPAFKPLILRTIHLAVISSYEMSSMLKSYKLTEDELASIRDRLASPSLVPQQRIALMTLLMALDYRQVASDLQVFINRYDLQATRRHGDADIIRYPLLGTDSAEVYEWQEWLRKKDLSAEIAK